MNQTVVAFKNSPQRVSLLHKSKLTHDFQSKQMLNNFCSLARSASLLPLKQGP